MVHGCVLRGSTRLKGGGGFLGLAPSLLSVPVLLHVVRLLMFVLCRTWREETGECWFFVTGLLPTAPHAVSCTQGQGRASPTPAFALRPPALSCDSSML